MDPQWEGLLRQSLRLLLQQAEIALLTRDTALFRSSLQRARDSLEYFQATAPAQLQAMTTEMESLLREPVGADLPDLSRSLEALERARASRRAAASGGGP
jgi:uroporphyrin-3 C-methyltransferase